QVNADDVGDLRYFDRSRFHFDAEPFCSFGVQRAAPADDAKSKRLGSRDHRLTYAAETDQSESAAVEPSGLAVLFLVPTALFEFRRSGRYATIKREDQTESQFSNRDRVLARTI